MSAPEIRPVEDEAGTRLSLELWNAVYPPMAASLAVGLDYQRSCLGHLDLVAFLGDRPAGWLGFRRDRAAPSERGRS
ncbi:MAG: hypothetical protein WEB90_00545 [Gemmatimonadota bacterium]